jgi:hypothetical protein
MNSRRMFFFVLLMQVGLDRTANATQTCNLTSSSEIITLRCVEFDALSDLNSELVSINSTSKPNIVMLKPSERILLTYELNMSLLANSDELYLYDLIGVNVYPGSFFSNCTKKTLFLSLSAIGFYVNNLPPNGYTCTSDLIPDGYPTRVSLFSAFINHLVIRNGNTQGSLQSQTTICPYVFTNAQLEKIKLFNQVNSFLFVTLFRFQQTNELTSALSISSVIKELSVYGYNYKLDTSLLLPLVFVNMSSLFVYNTVESIQTNLFKYFPQFDTISFT